MQINHQSVKNILVFRNDRFGEFLLNIPAFRALKEAFSRARIIAVVNPYVRELAQGIAFIDETMEWGGNKHSLMEQFRLMWALKKRHIDMAVMFNPSREFNIITYSSGIPVRVGYNRKLGILLTDKIEDKKYLGLKHEVEYNLELAALTGVKTDDKSLSLKTDSAAIGSLLKEHNIENEDNLVAVHPFTSDPLKQWPLDNFLELTAKIRGQLNRPVVVVGGREEAGKNSEFFARLDRGVINLAGKTSLAQLAALLKKCRLLVSGDSGPVHLACAVDTPVIAIFRNDIPGKTAKRWGPWQAQSLVIEKRSLLDISVDEVLEKVKEVVNK
ncbi:MAG: glycosyltransferase family 9 protein [Candidatus Omnitrophica bacterium]|nr:glycosyltransferase family 9 protein [Candidatus Omnitrophota bacterium]